MHHGIVHRVRASGSVSFPGVGGVAQHVGLGARQQREQLGLAVGAGADPDVEQLARAARGRARGDQLEESAVIL